MTGPAKLEETNSPRQMIQRGRQLGVSVVAAVVGQVAAVSEEEQRPSPRVVVVAEDEGR